MLLVVLVIKTQMYKNMRDELVVVMVVGVVDNETRRYWWLWWWWWYAVGRQYLKVAHSETSSQQQYKNVGEKQVWWLVVRIFCARLCGP